MQTESWNGIVCDRQRLHFFFASVLINLQFVFQFLTISKISACCGNILVYTKKLKICTELIPLKIKGVVHYLK